MKINQKIIFAGILVVLNLILGLLIFNRNNYQSVVEADSDRSKTTSVALKEEKELIKEEKEEIKVVEEVSAPTPEPVVEPVVEEPAIVYDGLTLEQLAAKLDRALSSTLYGQGMTFASYSLQLGIDPYLAVAIVLHETGCNWGCSGLVQQCNNVGGQKGSGCNGYQYFNTLDEGIKGFLDNLYYNYYAYGLTTAESMNSKYAESTTWAAQVNSYVATIKAS